MNTSKTSNLYRIVSFDRAVDIIKNKRLYFAHPSTWDDPYEQVLHHDQFKAIFAQCWCRKALSDAMWRIYSPNGLGVRIATTRQRLTQALQLAKKDKIFSFTIQNVEYLFQEELDFELGKARDRLAAARTFGNATAPLFLKRKAFDHEREARVVIHDPAANKVPEMKGITVAIDPFEVITSIWIDPRAPDSIVEAYKFYLEEKLDFPGTVEKSRLYLVPNRLSVDDAR